MGNSHFHRTAFHSVDCRVSSLPSFGNDSNTTTPKTDMSRSPSGSDIQDKSVLQLKPIDSLAQILLRKSQEEDTIHGITKGAFCRFVFPRHADFGEKVFNYLRTQAHAKTKHLGVTAFKQQCEKFLAILDDDVIRDIYVRMFAEPLKDEDAEHQEIRQSGFNSLLMTCYKLAMDYYCEGPQTCILIHRTLHAVIESCFHAKQSLSKQFVTHWLEVHCPRLIHPLHRFAVHCLTTAYRNTETEGPTAVAGIELATPVLDKPPPFPQGSVKSDRLMPVSQAWLLAATLPPLYSRPQNIPNMPSSSNGGLEMGISIQNFLMKLVSNVPSHWVLLYNSDTHGNGVNRFLHHVLAYRGPTLVILRAENGNHFCIASPNEWRETHLYWGTEEAAIVQLLPTFAVIEKGPKMLYLNTTIRGYPKGLRAGKDPRKPIISIDGTFEKIEFKSIPYNLLGIEVWGCGDQASREKQLDIKNWQFKEAERRREVKLTASDWLDHPDRYLLQLAGRQNYNNSNSN